MDVHTLVDIATLLSAIVGSVLATYRALLTRLRKVEERTALHEGALRAAGILTERRRRAN